MARLNEPASASDPAPTESTDTLKRRFLRQNREIAKANSAQSVRIRNLETEVAQLLSENLSLRGTIISLQRQLDRNKVDNVLDGVESVKGRLEAKVQELNELVKELGDTHNRARRRTLAVTVSCPRTKALDRWNTMQEQRKAYAQSETVREEEEKLAPIVEDKYYPRKTLSADEIHAISLDVNANTSFSPIIGSPPIARIEQDSEENDGELTQLPTNLETRRRRRNSIRKGEFTVLHTQKPEIFQESDPDLRHPEEPSTKLVRAGSKRKFDFAENQQISSSSVPDDVSFLRKGATGKNSRPSAAKRENGVSSRATQDLANARGILQEKSREISQRKTTQGRKALAPSKRNISSRISHLLKVFGTDKVSSESTNTEPASPTKRGNKPALPSNDAQKGPNAASSMVPNEEQKGGPKSVDITLTKVTDSLPIVKIKQEDIEPEPETPAGFDLFSSPSSKPSTARQDSRDTPPPPELDPSMSTADALHAGRVSRRAKSSVSYAEPNLRDKMRRPTKEMVDAVTGEGKGHRMSGVKLENGQYDREVDNSATERPSIRTVLIKKEEGSDGNWKNAPPSSREQRYRAGATSPLNGKSAAIEQLDNLGDANIGSDRSRRRMSTYSEEPRLPDDKLSSAAAAVTISTLVNGSKGIAEHGRRKEAAPLERRNEDPDIYNFDANSPPRKPPKISREELARSRASRRLSSVSSVQSTGTEESESEVDALGAKRSSRRQTLGGGAGRGKREETTAGGELRGAKSAAALSSQAEKGSQGRADGRRRSMMV